MGTPLNKLNGLDWTHDDVSKKFDNTYLKGTVWGVEAGVKKKLKEGLLYVKVSSHYAPGYCEIYGEKDGVIEQPALLAKQGSVVIDVDRPDPCLSNLGPKKAFIYMYDPARQWKRGWCEANSFIFSTPWKGKSRVRMWGVEYAKAIMAPQHTHLDEAITSMKKDLTVLGRALNNRYWLARKENEDVIQLYRRTAFMGSFLGKRFFISDEAKIFDDELKKELPILGTKYSYA